MRVLIFTCKIFWNKNHRKLQGNPEGVLLVRLGSSSFAARHDVSTYTSYLAVNHFAPSMSKIWPPYMTRLPASKIVKRPNGNPGIWCFSLNILTPSFAIGNSSICRTSLSIFLDRTCPIGTTFAREMKFSQRKTKLNNVFLELDEEKQKIHASVRFRVRSGTVVFFGRKASYVFLPSFLLARRHNHNCVMTYSVF